MKTFEKNERIAIMGGSFDPPHIGHEHVIRSAVKAMNLERVVIVPARLSPFKNSHAESGIHRLNMATIMCGSLKSELKNCTFSVWDREIRSHGPSYSWKTVQNLARSNPDSQIFFIIGQDNLTRFHKWNRWKTILENCELIVIPRARDRDQKSHGDSSDLIADIPSVLAEYTESVHFIDCEVLTISSTEVRNRIGDSNASQHWLNNRVYEYIRTNSLYSL